MREYRGLTTSRLRLSKIGPRYLGLLPDSPHVAPLLEGARPPGLVEKWSERVTAGDVVRAQGNFDFCGKGLWLVGRNGVAVATAVAQDLLIRESIGSLLYLRSSDFLASERPEGEREFRSRVDDDLLILSGYGDEHRTESGWVDSTLDALIGRRFDQGLPTIVTSKSRPKDSFLGNLSSDIFFIAVIMEVTHEED